MKLSSRKQLLIESENTLYEIRKVIKQKKLEENVITDMLSNIVNAIVNGITKMVRTGKQSLLYSEIPYLVGLDLINNSNIKVDKKILKQLDSIIKQLIKDVRESAELKKVISDLRVADYDVVHWRMMYQNSIRITKKEWEKMTKSSQKRYDSSREKLERAEKHFQNVLLKGVSNVVEKLISSDYRYKGFDDMIIKKLKDGVKGIKHEELQQIRDRFFNVLADRVAKEVESFDYDKLLTASEKTAKRLAKTRVRGD